MKEVIAPLMPMLQLITTFEQQISKTFNKKL